ncbi:head-tail joining protein [Pseudogemmobacter sp. W21_MBD1_M6]|uniref:head-tail joining protein n=1 Tax=Pseudogemmobacter sp. W21_MBD1_M6 TaxID=3240271 RepID=UPI003F9DC073
MTAFAAAMALLFADPNLATEAWHRDSEGQFTRITVMSRRADAVTHFGDARLWSESVKVDVRVSQLPDPRPDEQILIGDETFLIQGAPVRDRDRLIWTIDLAPA